MAVIIGFCTFLSQTLDHFIFIASDEGAFVP